LAFEVEERRIDVADLELGMFVCRLDRPWHETPFPLQGVELTSLEQIDTLRQLCREVYVDTRRLVPRDQVLAHGELSRHRFRNSTKYTDLATIEDEAPRAHAALTNASKIVDSLFQDVASGRELSVERVEQAVRPLVASVLRSADAFFLVEGLRQRDNYSYRHAVGCSALAATFGRHMGFDEETIFSLAAGGLLMDVGKTRVSETLLQYPGSLAPDEVDLVRSHVRHGLDIIAESNISNLDVQDIVRCHHERHDGSGYPEQLSGNVIPITGRMLAIIDSYHAMSNARPYRAAMSQHQALQQLYAARNTLYQAEMIEQFQVCLGVYPTGSLVELSTGEVAIVMAQNQVRRLRPRVAILSTPDKQPLNDFRRVDLMYLSEKDAVDITRNLAAGDYSIDATQFFLQ
jgi:HD-GYP domain-containing protein (c-di-GMP phosphodiesterase class II)